MNKRQMKDSDKCQAFGCYAIGTEYVEMELDNDKVINIWACERCAKKLSGLKLSILDNKSDRDRNRNNNYPKDRKLPEYYEDEKENLIKTNQVVHGMPVEVQ